MAIYTWCFNWFNGLFCSFICRYLVLCSVDGEYSRDPEGKRGPFLAYIIQSKRKIIYAGYAPLATANPTLRSDRFPQNKPTELHWPDGYLLRECRHCDDHRQGRCRLYATSGRDPLQREYSILDQTLPAPTQELTPDAALLGVQAQSPAQENDPSTVKPVRTPQPKTSVNISSPIGFRAKFADGFK